MKLSFTSECLNCGKHHDGGGMTGITSDPNSGNDVEHIHMKVLYDDCCRYQGMIDHKVPSRHEPDDPAWLAFLQAEDDAFIEIKTITRNSNGTPTHEVTTKYGHGIDWSTAYKN